MINNLRQLDSEVWVVNAARIIQTPFQPCGSKDCIQNEYGSICYRGIYYYSSNPERPYVAMIKNKNLSLPLVRTCNKYAFECFLEKFEMGEFSWYDVTVQLPSGCI